MLSSKGQRQKPPQGLSGVGVEDGRTLGGEDDIQEQEAAGNHQLRVPGLRLVM